MNNCLSGTMSLGANLLSIFVPSYFLTVTNTLSGVAFCAIDGRMMPMTRASRVNIFFILNYVFVLLTVLENTYCEFVACF